MVDWYRVGTFTTLVLILLVLSPGVPIPILNTSGSGGLSEPVSITNAYLGSIPNIDNTLTSTDFATDAELSQKLDGTTFTAEDFAQESTQQDVSSDVDRLAATIGEDGTSIDSFGTLISNDMRTQLDIASSYPFNPERLRLFLNGDREFYQYGDYNANKFEDESDTYSIRPGGGDTMHIESAESATYVVGTQMASSFAFQLNQSLSGDDRIRIGPYNGQNGWYMEHRGNHTNSSVVDLVMVRDGERTVMEQNAVLPKPLTGWHRYEVDFNWYNVGNQKWIQTYTDDGEQFNTEFATTSVDGVKGPETANLNLWYEITADATTSNLELDVGSMGFAVQSGADQLVRGKPQRIETSVPAGDDIWHPVYAIKLVNNTSVNARLNEFEAMRYTNNAPVELVAVSVDPSKTDATNFTVPGYQHQYNSQLRDTFDVTTAPAENGTEVDPTSSDFKFGGWTVSASSVEPTGSNFQAGASTAAQTTVKRQLLASDVVIVFARSSSAGGTVTFDYVAEQDY